MNVTEAESKVFSLIKYMKIPEKRKEKNETNIKWLGQNLFLQNKNNVNYPEVKKILIKLDVPVFED